MAEHEPNRQADDYEARYMSGHGGVLYRDKLRAPGLFHAIMAVPTLFTLLMTIPVLMGWGSKPAPPEVALLTLGITAFLGLCWVLFSVLRITVSRDELVVQYGVFGPRIAITSIESCEVVDYDAMKYGGWGIKRAADGSWAYNMIGDEGRAVKVVYRDGNGTSTILLSSPSPERLALAITEARAAAVHRLTEGRIRLDAPRADDITDADAEAAQSAEEQEKHKADRR